MQRWLAHAWLSGVIMVGLASSVSANHSEISGLRLELKLTLGRAIEMAQEAGLAIAPVSGDAFDRLGITPAAGRLIGAPDDSRPGASPVARRPRPLDPAGADRKRAWRSFGKHPGTGLMVFEGSVAKGIATGTITTGDGGGTFKLTKK